MELAVTARFPIKGKKLVKLNSVRNNKHNDGKRLAIFIVLEKFLNNSADVRTVLYRYTSHSRSGNIYD